MVTATIYLSHEGLTKRGANEIASYLFNYLTIKDRERVEKNQLILQWLPRAKQEHYHPGVCYIGLSLIHLLCTQCSSTALNLIMANVKETPCIKNEH